MNSFIEGRKEGDSPEAEIKNETVTPAIGQAHTESSSAVQCRTPLRNSVFLITDVGSQVSAVLPSQFCHLY
jgi:hypothetical protein